MVTRRGILELTVRAAALPGAAQFFSEWLRGAQSHAHSPGTGQSQAPPQPPFLQNYQPKFFSVEDLDALRAMTEILIPTDETPGAREAHCAEFIDFVLSASTDYAPQTQQRWRAAMRAVKATGFYNADPERKMQIIEEISKPERDAAAQHPAYAAYRLIKRENTFAFYTSRAGMIGTLDYRGNTYNLVFPACNHPEHHVV